MICPNCKQRWADFPESDFYEDDNGVHPKNEEAEERRVKAFDSNEIKYCGCMETE